MQFLRKPRILKVITGFPLQLSNKRAGVRQLYIEQSGVLDTKLDGADTQLYEFFETPPGFPPVERKLLKSDEAITHYIILETQLDHTEKMLCYRLTDLVDVAVRLGKLPGDTHLTIAAYPIRMQKDSKNNRLDRLDYYNVIETTHPEEYYQFLRKYTDWLATDLEIHSYSRLIRMLPK